MKRQWHIQRQLLPMPDGQHRWDRAYQQLLSWAAPAVTVQKIVKVRPTVRLHGRVTRWVRVGASD